MQLHLRINNMTAEEAAHFIDEKTPFCADDTNEEFETVIFEVEDQADADALEMALQDIFGDEMLGGTFELIDDEGEKPSFEDYCAMTNTPMPDPKKLGADGFAMVYGLEA